MFSIVFTYQFTFLPTVLEGCLFSHPLQYLSFVDFLMIAILTGMLPHCGFDLHSSNIIGILSIFSCACWPFLTFLEACLFRSSTHFLMGLFSWYWVVWAACIFWILTPCWLHNQQFFFSHSGGSLFVLLIVSFAV